ncbi:unnamed protein product [Rangifer tarandus platyrhynchus]|uniref:Uncharacterized protein n=1 Tax=Rangifer tarandus platyrhynchus TaxID=3082113 RepID=A0AC59Y933_RANTA
MASEVMSRLLFRVLLPCSLLSAVLSRYNGFSVVYLVFLLLSPLLGAPSAGCMRGSTKLFLRAVRITSVLFLLLQGALQVAFVSLGPEGAVWEEAIQHLGVIRFSRVDVMDIVRLLAPDIGMALVGLVTARLGHELARPPGTTAPSPFDTMDHEEDETAGERDSMEHYESDTEGDVPCWCSELSDEKATEAEGTSEEWVLKVAAFTSGLKAALEPFFPAAWKVLVTLLLGAAGMISPSMTSAVYFGAFLGLGSWWACGQALSTMAFSTLCVFMAIFTAGHLGGLYIYQLPFFQNCVPPDDIYARLLGMTALIRTNHTEFWKLHLHPGLSWPEMVNPLILLLSYYTLVLLLQQQALQSGEPEEREAVPTRSPSRGEHQELRSVLWTSGSEEEQVTPLPGGSWQDLPLLRGAPGQCLDLDPPASFVSEKSQTSSGHAASATPTESGLSCASVLGYLAIRHSHVPALITMMVWSICFTGWPGCLLLLWACVIWMARDPCRLALRSAPFLVGYASVLIVLSFVAGLRVSQEELFPGAPGWLLADMDLKPYLQPCLHLAVFPLQSLCASVFWLLLRLQVSESQRPAEEEAWRGDLGDVSGPSSVLLSIPATILKSLLVEYWLCLGAALLFAVSFAGKVVVYRVVYILLFLFWVAWYQIHYSSWRRSSKCFWMLVVSYSMVVLFAVYTFQFQAVSGFFNETLGLSKEGLRDLGLQRFHVATLFAELLLPAALLLAGILHCRCCNEDLRRTTGLHNSPITWEGSSDRLRRSGEEEATQNCADKASSSERKAEESGRLGRKVPAEEETGDWDLAVDKPTAGFQKFLEMVNGTQAFLRRVLETHSIKLLAPVVVWLTLQEASLMNSVFYIFWVLSLPYSTLRPFMSRVSTVWACVIVVCRVMYQLKWVVPSAYASNCTQVWRANGTRPPALLAGGLMVSLQPVDPAEWLGALTKCDGRALPCLKNQLAVLALTTLDVMVSQRQSIHRLREGLSGPLASATLDTVTRAHLDHGLMSALQYFIHFGFYKFGLELCFVAALHTVGQRMDFYALIHIIWLVYLLNLRRRKAIAEVWPRYCGFLVCLIIFQYFLCLGLPPALCKDYPWRTTSTEIHSNLIKWLYLPDYAKKPDANLLFFDFLLLLAASLQWQVFVDENTASMRLRAGDNVEISRELRPTDLAQLSPVLNFIFCRSYLDMVKVAVFRYHFWFVLCLVFLAGTTRIHILSAGYLAAFGYFMLQGSHLLLQPAKTILQPWDRLVAYSALVVAVKTFLSVGACVYLEALLKSHCWLVHIFGLSCTVPGYQLAIPEDEACEPPEKEAGILWDAVCLTFLLIQRRIFLSYYHLYVVADLEAAQALASRGAELLALSLREALEHSEEDEKKCLWVITRQIEKIKAKQRKVAALQRGSRRPASPVVSVSCLPREVAATGPSAPDDLSTTENEEEKKWWQPWTKHPSMLQDGSYTFFETDSEEEELKEVSEAEITDRQPKPRTAFQLAYKAWTDGAACALRMRMEDEWGMGNPECDEEGLRWRHSGGGERLATRETEAEARAESSDEPGSLARRLVTVAQLCRVLGQVLLDDVTEALRALGGDSARVSRALRGLRHGWWRAVTQGKKATTEDILRGCHARLREAPCAAPARREERLEGHPEGKGLPGSCPEDTRSPGEMEQGPAQEDPPRNTCRSRQGPPHQEALEDPLRQGAGCPQPQGAALPQDNPRCQGPPLEQSDRFCRSLPRLVKLTFALHQAAMAKSETLCYLVIILNHTLSASILSMVLPILSFLWAMLSVPRPSKRFWMAAIYYTEATVVVKYFSQFGLFPWTTKRYAGINREKPFSLPNILGVEKRDGSVLGDLVQLLALFFHRNTLQGLGLWDQPPCDQAHCKGERKSRRQRRNASGGSPGGGHLRRRADLDLSSQELPLSPPAPNWAFWRRWWATGHRGGPQDPGSRKTWSLLRKQSLRQKQLNRSLLETLEETGKLGVRRSLRIYHSIRRFFSNLRQPPASPVRDVYTLAFLVEVLNLVIVLFGYWAFGKHSASDLAESLSEETVPGAFLVMVLVQFGMMLVDRALYLRKAVLGKCAFQILLVLGTHLWLFFILPGITMRRFNLNHVAQTWYLVKCIYFGLSAYQIRHGYPNWILGNCLTKNFSLVNLILFKGFRVVPFLLELRAVIDWMWTNTSLSLSNWTCLEDLYANIFIMKCHQESEKKYPQPPGRPQKRAMKYGLGGIATFALVFLMWFPLVFMSLVKTVGGVTNQPLQVSVKIAINGYETLFSMSAQQHNLVPFSDADYDRLTQQYALHPSAMQFLADYRPEDIVLAKIKSHASLLWGVSPTDRSAMVQELANTTAICITTSWAVQRNVSLVKNVEASGKHMVCYRDAEIRDQLVYTLSLVRKEPVMLPGLIPKALRTTEGTEVKMAHQLEVAHPHRPRDVDRLAFFRNATIQLQQLRPVEAPVASPAAEWWMVQEWRPGCEQSRGCSQDLELVIFNDKVSPQSLGFLAGYGIVGLYVSVVMVAAKFIRDHFLGIARSIMHDQLPDVDRVLGLCTDIFLVRELGELQLEQELFARLTFLYRSPETMIKWTRQRPPTPCLPPTNPVAAAPVERLEAAVVSSSPLASEK